MWIYFYIVGGIIVALSILCVQIRRGEITLQDVVLMPIFSLIYPVVIIVLLIEFGGDIVLWKSKKEVK